MSVWAKFRVLALWALEPIVKEHPDEISGCKNEYDFLDTAEWIVSTFGSSSYLSEPIFSEWLMHGVMITKKAIKTLLFATIWMCQVRSDIYHILHQKRCIIRDQMQKQTGEPICIWSQRAIEELCKTIYSSCKMVLKKYIYLFFHFYITYVKYNGLIIILLF